MHAAWMIFRIGFNISNFKKKTRWVLPFTVLSQWMFFPIFSTQLTRVERQGWIKSNQNVHPWQFNSEFAPEKSWERKMVLSYWVLVTFQGRAVKLPGGKNTCIQNQYSIFDMYFHPTSTSSLFSTQNISWNCSRIFVEPVSTLSKWPRCWSLRQKCHQKKNNKTIIAFPRKNWSLNCGQFQSAIVFASSSANVAWGGSVQDWQDDD